MPKKIGRHFGSGSGNGNTGNGNGLGILEPLLGRTPNLKSLASVDPEKVFELIKAGETAKPEMVRLNRLVLEGTTLKVDLRYQYDPDKEDGRKRGLRRFLENHQGFSKPMAGVLHVNIRPNGEWVILDGAGRVYMALFMVEPAIRELPVIFWHLETWQEEAFAFIGLNKHKRTIKPPHLFVVAAAARDSIEREIVDIVERFGFQIEKEAGNKGHILTTTSLVWAHVLGVLEVTLADLKSVWGSERTIRDSIVGGRHVTSVAAVIANNPRIDHKRLRKTLAEKFDGPKELDNEGRVDAQTIVTASTPQSRDINPCIAKVIVSKYNKGLDASKRISGDFRGLEERFSHKNDYKDVWTF